MTARYPSRTRALTSLCALSALALASACESPLGGRRLDAGAPSTPDGALALVPDAEALVGDAGTLGCGEVPELAPLFAAPPSDERPLWWTADDGALVTRGAGRVRGRHENEAEFSIFHPLYFENRTFEFLVEDTVAAGGTTIHITWLPLVRNRNPNLRVFYTGDGNVFFHNVDMQEHDLGGGRFAYDYTVERNFRTGEPLRAGDLMEFEFGVFLSTAIEGRTNYYTDTYRYVVGTPGLVPLTEPGEGALSAGAATIPQIIMEPELSFSQYALNLPLEWLTRALDGRRRFHTDMRDGAHTEALGPVLPALSGLAGPFLNEASCIGCHARDGRGRPPAEGASALGSSVLRLASASDPSSPDPLLGGQLQDRATSGAPEASFSVRWEASIGEYADGARFELVRPVFDVSSGGAAPLVSARIAPQLVGLGLLEAVDAETITALADAADCDGDGISGRAAVVTDPVDGRPRLGRFGWRASKPSLVHQTAGALANDMGVTTSLFTRVDCGAAQSGCGELGPAELSDDDLTAIATYVRALGVPPRRDLDDPAVARGEAIFAEAGCASCHTATLRTGTTHPIASLRDQLIHPYTDMLLHDMGEGLADQVQGEGAASGNEWRTPPLWGIGLTEVVSGETHFLHDGRARTLEEAILWHGGEAEASREHFRALAVAERDALVAFLQSL